MTVDPGRRNGVSPPRLTLQWQCDGRDIPGATGSAYTPRQADDRKLLTCRISSETATGSASWVSPALRVTHVAPRVREALCDEIFDHGGGEQILETAGSFSGEDLTFSVTGPGARIDPRSGRLTLATDRPLSGENIEVRAENSGGAAVSAFLTTVEAEGVAPAAAGVFVDYEKGDDGGDGSPAAPRKSVPADLAPGATVFFRRGSVYRAPIVVASAGTAADPIALDFESWGNAGDPAALVDLSAVLSAPVPGGTIGSAPVYVCDFPAHVAREAWIKTLLLQQDAAIMGLAQLPTPASFARVSDLDEWFDYDRYEHAGTPGADWREYVTAPAAFSHISGSKIGLLLRVWHWGNGTAVYKVVAYDAATGRAEVVPYLHSRPLTPRPEVALRRRKLAIVNHPDCLKADGQYLVDTTQWKITLRPFGGAKPGAARFASAAGPGGSGIEIRAPYVEIYGARVRMVAGDRSISSGILLKPAPDRPSAGLALHRCRVEDCVVGGAGIYVYGKGRSAFVQDPLVQDCHVKNMLGSSCRGIFFNGVQGGMLRSSTADVTSSTGISCYTCEGTRIYGNVSGRPAGVHGNGFSFYEGCRNLVIAFNTVHQPEASGMALTMQSGGRNAVVFNDLVMGEKNTVAWYGPKDRHAELGRHLFANNNILNRESGKAVMIASFPLWSEVPRRKIRAGAVRRDPGDPARRAWVAVVASRGAQYPGQTFAQYRAANPGHWKLYGDGSAATWARGMPSVGMVMVNNIVDNILSRDVAEANSYAVRTRNMYVSSYAASVGLTRPEAQARGEYWQVSAKQAIFRDWREGDLRPTDAAWAGLLRGKGYVYVINGVTVDWVGRYRMEGGVARDAWDWQNEPL